MYNKRNKPTKTDIYRNTSYIGEQIEDKVKRILNNKEPITDGAPIIFTERKDGVMPQYDIRTDRFEIAIDAMDAASKSWQAKREERASLGEQAKEGMKKEDAGTGMKKEGIDTPKTT